AARNRHSYARAGRQLLAGLRTLLDDKALALLGLDALDLAETAAGLAQLRLQLGERLARCDALALQLRHDAARRVRAGIGRARCRLTARLLLRAAAAAAAGAAAARLALRRVGPADQAPDERQRIVAGRRPSDHRRERARDQAQRRI